MERHVLVIMPHPDDETLACGGTIALHTRAGTPVTYVCGTRGEMGRNMGRPPFATRESLPLLRERELREACEVLGITDLRFLGLRDKTIEFVDPDELAERLRAIVVELNPSLVLTYHPTHSVHPDHMALGRATVQAVASLPADQRPPVHTRAFGKNIEELGAPDLVVDATAVIETKLKATAAHRSQTQLMFSDLAVRSEQDPAARQKMAEQRAKESYWIWRF